MNSLHGDVAVIGGSFGGVAAAIALVERGRSVVLTEEFPWIGGQVSSQALCVLDDLYDPSGEATGISRRYAEFRRRTRDWYKSHYPLSLLGEAQLHLCAGNTCCSHLTAEPNVAHSCLQEWLEPAVASGQLKVLTGVAPVRATRQGNRVQSVVCKPTSGNDTEIEIAADFFLDGTETGDTYPLLPIPYRLGSESRQMFGEPHAGAEAIKSAIQCFTYCAVVEYVPGGNFVIAKPHNYERVRDRKQFYLSSTGASPQEPAYFFQPRILQNGRRIIPFWHYRCLVDAANFQNVTGRAVINVGSIDFDEEAYLESPRREQVLQRARALTRCYLYWLQTEAPRDEGGYGYPELRPMPEATGTPDGIAMAPYVREGRRLVARRTIVEQDVACAFQPGSRARPYADSVGLAGYAIDIHHRAASPDVDGHSTTADSVPGVWELSRPYQIPLSAMITAELANFAAAGKGIGVTQVANGAYRLHPAEWAIGEAAGELAAFCLERQCRNVLDDTGLLEFQRRLVTTGVPIYWYDDLPLGQPGFAAAQLLAVKNVWPGSPDHLRFEGHQSLATHQVAFAKAMAKCTAAGLKLEEFRQACLNAHNGRKYDVLHRLLAHIDHQGWPAALLKGDSIV